MLMEMYNTHPFKVSEDMQYEHKIINILQILKGDATTTTTIIKKNAEYHQLCHCSPTICNLHLHLVYTGWVDV